jgi:hypothetical protein
MAQHRTRLAGSQGQVYSTSVKLSSVTIALTGDRVWNLRQVNVSGAIKYKVSAGVPVPHNDLHIPFRDALFAEVASGTTGEINIQVE